jgi:hypothetical protein
LFAQTSESDFLAQMGGAFEQARVDVEDVAWEGFAARVSNVGTSPQHAMTTSGSPP